MPNYEAATHTAPKYDAIVIGLGAIGSAAAWRLSARGARVLGLEQFSLLHEKGSSHGHTRIFREAYFESPHYIPLLKESRRFWAELSARTERDLFFPTGLLSLSAAERGGVVEKTQRHAAEHDIPLEILSHAEIRHRYPALRLPENFRGVFEPGAGYLLAEESLRAMQAAARVEGADLRAEVPVLQWEASEHGVLVRTSQGDFEAARLVFAAGVWARRQLPELALPIDVRRVVPLWFESTPALATLPCFALDLPDHFVYGFPPSERGWKVSLHDPGGDRLSDPVAADGRLRPGDVEPVAAALEKYFLGYRPKVLGHTICRYGLTPDEDFLVGLHPEYPSVSFVAGLSGHGFKFAPLLGDILADFALNGETERAITFLSPRRFAH